MKVPPKEGDIDAWISPPDPNEQPEPDYREAVRAAIAQGRADIEAGRCKPAEEVWKELGIGDEPFPPTGPKSPGYDEWLQADIEAGIAELDAGKGIPAEEVWKTLGTERES